MVVFARAYSHYSIGSGFCSVPDLVDDAARSGLSALMLTDRETLAGQPALHARARQPGLRALTGLELDWPGCRRGGLVLVARDDGGYASLCDLVSRRRGARTRSGPLSDGLLGPLPDGAPGLFWLTTQPAVAHELITRPGLDRSRVRLLLTRPASHSGREREIASLARAERIPVIADLFATLRSDRERAGALLAAKVLSGPPESPVPLPLPEHIAGLFADAPEAVAGAGALLESCTLDLRPGPPILPAPRIPAGVSAEAWLRIMSDEALQEARGEGRCLSRVYESRLAMELSVIGRAGFAPYFLLVRELSRVAASLDIPVAVRGSAGASLVLHLLGLTRVDPVATDLLFERFLNEFRRDLPDVDLDVCAERRSELLEAIFNEFGRERVAQIATYQTLGRASALDRGLVALGATEEERAAVEGALPHMELRAEISEDAWSASMSSALRPTRFGAHATSIRSLVGLPSHLSVHPGGIVIGDRPLERLAPLEQAPKGVPVLQYDLESAAWLGFVKVDLLGNLALTQIRATVDALRHRDGRPAAPARLLLRGGAASAPEDPATLDLIRSADTVGCFQIETPPVRDLLSRMPVKRAADLVTAIALVRPGPGAAAAREGHLASAGRVRPLLYEDDVVRAIADATGQSIAEADRMRADLVDAGDDTDAVRAVQREFLAAAVRAGTAAATARGAWSSIRHFAAYAFNKAHAASYAALAWECAYLRTHATAEYACAVLDHYGGSYPLRSVASAFARAGLEIRAPHVLHSNSHSHVEAGGAVRLGLRRVKSLSASTIESILAARDRGPFGDLDAFVERVRPGARELRALLLSGCLDDLDPLDAASYPLPHLDALSGTHAQTRLALGDPVRPGSLPSTDRDRLLLRVRAELRYLEMHPSAHPMALVREDANALGATDAIRTAKAPAGTSVTFAGIVAASRRIPVGRGVVHFLTMEDETGLIELVLGPRLERSVHERISTPGPYLVVGTRVGGGLPRLEVQSLVPFHERSDRSKRERRNPHAGRRGR